MSPRGARGLVVALALPVCIVAGASAALLGGEGGAFPATRIAVGALVALSLASAAFALRPRRAALLQAAALVVVLVLFALHRPQRERNWSVYSARVPRTSIDGSLLRIQNVRNFEHHSPTQATAAWYDHTYDLAQLVGADFVLTRFGPNPGIGHVMLRFRFASGPNLMASVEVRKEVGESYHPLSGLFQQYELHYVFADERDALALRVDVDKDPTWVLPLNAQVDNLRAALVHMAERAERLATHPEWYHTVWNSCASNLAHHYGEVAQIHLPPDRRVLLPGHSAALLAELDLLPAGMSVEAALERYRMEPGSVITGARNGGDSPPR